MAVYAVSDIHGALDEFERLLKKIGFQGGGSDTLYLLGDYGDWGAKSMETLRFVQELDENYENVHCLLGNHEQMFLDTIASGYRGSEPDNQIARNWIVNNHGQVTWDAFADMRQQDRRKLVAWMSRLPLSYSVSVEGHLYMLAHAFPYHYDVEYPEQEAQRRRKDAIWHRMLISEDPFEQYKGQQPYETLICGHTISDYYYQQARTDGGKTTLTPSVPQRNRIFHGNRFVDIDCGAKCMDEKPGEGEVIHAAAMRAQLAAYRLDDQEEFYVHRTAAETVAGGMDMHLPDMHLPDMHLPDMHLPDVHLPDMNFLNKYL